jgi:hypothetical protein
MPVLLKSLILKIKIISRSDPLFYVYICKWPVTVAARSKARIVFAGSDAGIVGSNPTRGMNVWCVYAFLLCLCCPVCR